MSVWKQPVITEVPELEGDPFAKTVYQVIIINACNKERQIRLKDGSLVHLQRGDCLFGRHSWNKKFGLPPDSRKIQRLFKNCHFLTNRLTIKSFNKYTIISIKDYDELVSFDQQNDLQMTSKRPHHILNKNIKNDKQTVEVSPPVSASLPNGTETLKAGLSEFEVFWNEYPRKEGKKVVQSKYLKLIRANARTHEIIMGVLSKHNNKWRGMDKKYIPMPITWLNQERWNDEIEETTAKKESIFNFNREQKKWI